MDIQELSELANSIYTDLNKALNDVFLPLAKVAITAVTLANRSKLTTVGLRPSVSEDTYKATVMTIGVINRYMTVIMAGIGTVIAVQQLRELDRDKYTPELTIALLKPLIKIELTKRINAVDFGGGFGVKALFYQKIADIGTDVLVDLVLDLL
jgi:hypothetical protein